MSLRPLLEIAAEDERLHALAGRVRAASGGEAVEIGVSAALRPLLLATLLEDDRGLAAAKYLLLSSRTVGADEALRLGLVNRVAPAAGTEDAAMELAAQVASHPPEAVARLKRMLHEWDGVEERTRVEGEGQVEWQREGPGLPYGDVGSTTGQ